MAFWAQFVLHWPHVFHSGRSVLLLLASRTPRQRLASAKLPSDSN